MRFVDSSFWIALRFVRDQWHEAAAHLWLSAPGPFQTSDLVVGETWTFLAKRAGHRRAVQFLNAVEQTPRLVVTHIDEDIAEAAWKWLRRHDERPYSFVDATSFVLMRRARMTEALTFDGDFAAAGFIEVRP